MDERIEMNRMTEEGRERIDPRRVGVEMERSGRREGRTSRPRRGSKWMPNGNAESSNGW